MRDKKYKAGKRKTKLTSKPTNHPKTTPVAQAEELLKALVARTHELPADRCVLDPDGSGVKLLPRGQHRVTRQEFRSPCKANLCGVDFSCFCLVDFGGVRKLCFEMVGFCCSSMSFSFFLFLFMSLSLFVLLLLLCFLVVVFDPVLVHVIVIIVIVIVFLVLVHAFVLVVGFDIGP